MLNRGKGNKWVHKEIETSHPQSQSFPTHLQNMQSIVSLHFVPCTPGAKNLVRDSANVLLRSRDRVKRVYVMVQWHPVIPQDYHQYLTLSCTLGFMYQIPLPLVVGRKREKWMKLSACLSVPLATISNYHSPLQLGFHVSIPLLLNTTGIKLLNIFLYTYSLLQATYTDEREGE